MRAAPPSEHFGLDYWNGSPHDIPEEMIRRVPYTFVRAKRLLPVHWDGSACWIALSHPQCSALEDLELILGCPVRAVFCPEEALLPLIEQRYRAADGMAERLLRDATGHVIDEEEGGPIDLLDDSTDSPAIRFLNAVLAESIQIGASDIHFDPMEDQLRIRYRDNGILQDHHAPSRELVGPLVTRLKVLAKLDIAEHRLPQDGRIRVQLAGREADFRVSTIPCLGGERIVLRLLDKSHVALGLDYLGLPDPVSVGLKRCLQRSEGLILVTGPTGSGKTTTLYSAVRDLLSAERNIMTIEDPIEVRLPGIAQIQVQPKIGFDFAAGLRHILRQDPDIILVGEIRDRETAEIALQASLTGHLVLSTLHTNDAASAIARLVDMGIEPYLISSALLGILAQRLVRRLCPKCRVPVTISPLQQREWQLPDATAAACYTAKGCPACQQSGTAGRCGIYEWLPMTSDLQREMLECQDAVTLKRLAVGRGLQTLRTQALRLCSEGIIAGGEVARVTSPDEM